MYIYVIDKRNGKKYDVVRMGDKYIFDVMISKERLQPIYMKHLYDVIDLAKQTFTHFEIVLTNKL